MTDPVAIDLLQQAKEFILTCSAPNHSPEALLASINTYLSMDTHGNSTTISDTIDDLAAWAMIFRSWS